MRYPIVMHKEPESDYGVTVPDLPGCFSAGETMDEALEQAVEAIECHMEGLMMDQEAIPMPKSIEYHQNNPDYAGGIWALVSVDPSKLLGGSQQVNITLPERLLNVVDNYAARYSKSRSGFMVQAALEFIASHP